MDPFKSLQLVLRVEVTERPTLYFIQSVTACGQAQNLLRLILLHENLHSITVKQKDD